MSDLDMRLVGPLLELQALGQTLETVQPHFSEHSNTSMIYQGVKWDRDKWLASLSRWVELAKQCNIPCSANEKLLAREKLKLSPHEYAEI